MFEIVTLRYACCSAENNLDIVIPNVTFRIRIITGYELTLAGFTYLTRPHNITPSFRLGSCCSYFSFLGCVR